MCKLGFVGVENDPFIPSPSPADLRDVSGSLRAHTAAGADNLHPPLYLKHVCDDALRAIAMLMTLLHHHGSATLYKPDGVPCKLSHLDSPQQFRTSHTPRKLGLITALAKNSQHLVASENFLTVKEMRLATNAQLQKRSRVKNDAC